VMKGNGDHEVVIEFDPWAADVVRGRQWHSSQQVTDLPDGGSRMTMRLSALEEVERWVLSWGTHATVISPLALANRVRSIAAALVHRYASPIPS
jgi:predicted DNA-binding transcriptional regulator YafY